MCSNASYRKGANFERRVRKKLERMGAFVVRSAGSKGVFDLIAIFPNGVIWGVQCKTNPRIHKDERSRIINVSKHYPISPILATKVDRKIEFIDLREIEKFIY